MGYLHHIENLNGISTSEFIIGFSHESPEVFNLSSTFCAITQAAPDSTSQSAGNVSKDPIMQAEEEPIVKLKRTTNIDHEKVYIYPNRYKFDLEKMPSSSVVSQGSVKIASKVHWPILENVSMHSLRISSTDALEPHWHLEATEIGFIVHGNACLIICSPHGYDRLHMVDLQSDDVYFVPRGWPHYIKLTGTTEVKLLIFYDHSNPSKLSCAEGCSAYEQVLGTRFRLAL